MAIEIKLDYEVKPVTKNILKEVVEMLVNGYAEEYPALHTYNFDTSYKSLLSFIGQKNIIFNYILNDTSIMGAFCANTYIHPFSGYTTCNELFWYIKREFRKMQLGNKSFSLLEEWALKENCTVLDIACPDIENNKGLKRFLISKGFKAHNTNMIKHLKEI
jgi:hypothetical protein